MVRYYNFTAIIEEELKVHKEEFYKNIGSHKTNKTTLISGSCWNSILHICKHEKEVISKIDLKYIQSQTK